jgi:hypothetical protein
MSKINYSYVDEKFKTETPEGDVIVFEPSLSEAREPREFVPKPRKKRKTVKKPYVKKKDRIERLTEKQKRFVANVAKGLPFNRAAYDAYEAKSLESAAGLAHRNLQNPTIKELVLKVLDKKGINLDVALEPLVKSLKAKKAIQWKDELIVTEVDDLELQLKAADRALKLMGVSYKDESNAGGNNYIQINNIHKDKYDD